MDSETRRGPGRAGKDQVEIKRARVTSEPAITDWTCVNNKDPEMHYVIVRQSNPREIIAATAKGYVPAMGREEFVMATPLLGGSKKESGEGQPKVFGDRILMCCPKHKVETREAERLARQAARDGELTDEVREYGKRHHVQVNSVAMDG